MLTHNEDGNGKRSQSLDNNNNNNSDQLTDFPSLESIMTLRERRNSTSNVPGRLDLASHGGIMLGHDELTCTYAKDDHDDEDDGDDNGGSNNNNNNNTLYSSSSTQIYQQQWSQHSNAQQTTIAVQGLPQDMCEREFVNLFCFAPGFEVACIRPNDNGDGVGTMSTMVEPSSTTMELHHPSHNTSNFISVGMPSIWSSSSTSTSTQSSFLHSMPPSPGPQATAITSASATGAMRVGLARFSCRVQALAARDHLHGRFLGQHPDDIPLHVDLVKRNVWTTDDLVCLFEQQSIGGGTMTAAAATTATAAAASRRHSTLSVYPSPTQMYGNGNQFVNRYQQLLMYTGGGYSGSTSGGSIGGNGLPSFYYHQHPYYHDHDHDQQQHHHQRRFMPTNSNNNGNNENPPCNTLYVGNLPPMATEDELRALFSPCPGFKRLSFRHKPNGPMCFVEFDDIPLATSAMQTLYGTPLSCSSKGGIRLSYSKNPLGVRSPIVPGSSSIMMTGGVVGSVNSSNSKPFVYSANTVNPPFQ